MLYPVYIHIGDDQHAHGAIVHDFPGCFSAADTWQELPKQIQEAIELWCEGENMALPAPTALDALINHPDYEDGYWMLFDVDTSRLETRSVRLNISLPQGLLSQIDAYAASHGASRSGFLAQAARQAMQQ